MNSFAEGKTQHIFTWTIENFGACTQKSGKYLDSPVFIAESLDETTWFVRLYPRGDRRASEEFVSCYLYRSANSFGPDEVECNYSLEAIDKNNKSIAKHEFSSKFAKGISYGYPEFFQNHLELISIGVLKVKVILQKRLPKIFSKNICCTKIVTDKFSFKWNVKNFNFSDSDNKSVSFSDNVLFEIRIKIPEDEVQISILRKKGFTDSQLLICSVTLLDLKGEDSDSKETILEADKPHDDTSWVFPTFLQKSKITAEKFKYLKEDYFTLRFDFALSNGRTVESIENLECSSLDRVLKAKEDPTLKKDFKQLLTNPIHADVKLHVDETIICAHKVILCARSHDFSTMFHQDMAENQTGAIHISDIEAGTLNSLLEFMYTGDTEILDCESALKLLLASEKYQVLSLKEKCSSSLELLLCDENVCDILFTADLVQQESLKVCAVNRIKQNPKNIFKSDEWKKMADNNLKLATETFCEVSTH